MWRQRPGAAFDELGERLGRRFPERYHALRYPFIAHSTGLSDEYPTIVFEDHQQGEVRSGMVFSVEAYVGAEGGAEGIQLEEQVLVADTGTEVELGEWRGSNRGGPIRHSGGSRRCRNGRC